MPEKKLCILLQLFFTTYCFCHKICRTLFHQTRGKFPKSVNRIAGWKKIRKMKKQINQKVFNFILKQYEDKAMFIVNEQRMSFNQYAELVASQEASIMDAYERINADNRYFSPDPNFCR